MWVGKERASADSAVSPRRIARVGGPLEIYVFNLTPNDQLLSGIRDTRGRERERGKRSRKVSLGAACVDISSNPRKQYANGGENREGEGMHCCVRGRIAKRKIDVAATQDIRMIRMRACNCASRVMQLIRGGPGREISRGSYFN